MDIKAQVAEVIEDSVARVFRRDKAEIAAHHELRLKEDLNEIPSIISPFFLH